MNILFLIIKVGAPRVVNKISTEVVNKTPTEVVDKIPDTYLGVLMADLADTKDFLSEARKSALSREVGRRVYVDLVPAPGNAPPVVGGNIITWSCTLGSFLILGIIVRIFKAL
jgi:hypothetical protein